MLDDISLDLREGRSWRSSGRSGSGKSTLLRCIAGLIAPTAGDVSYRGQALNGANPGVAMVFQSFALLPWLTVRQNVELGLEALGVDRASDASGRSGRSTPSAWTASSPPTPRSSPVGCASGSGFARALVVEPDALLMDEPFSALDVLTAQNLRAELLRLWQEKDFPTKAMLIVTHNIEEAVILADRIFVLGANPGSHPHRNPLRLSTAPRPPRRELPGPGRPDLRPHDRPRHPPARPHLDRRPPRERVLRSTPLCPRPVWAACPVFSRSWSPTAGARICPSSPTS